MKYTQHKEIMTLTTDTFFNGRIKVKQHSDGYRFSIDSVLLSYCVRPGPGETVVDLGTGCGIIPLILAYRNPDIRIYGIEVQAELAEIATINARENRMEDRITILCEDMVTLKGDMLPKPADIVVCNPPYRKAESGRISPNRQRAIARHEIKVTLYEVVETACRMLDISGRFITIYPAERTLDILTQMRASNLEPKWLRNIHSYRHSNATLVLLQGIKGGHSGMKIKPPLIIYREDDTYTDEVEKMMAS